MLVEVVAVEPQSEPADTTSGCVAANAGTGAHSSRNAIARILDMTFLTGVVIVLYVGTNFGGGVRH